MNVHDIQGVVWIWWFGMSWEKFVSWKICLYWRFLVIRSWSQSWSNFENIDRNSWSNLGESLLLKERTHWAILGSLRFFIVTHVVFSSVGAEVLTGGSVVPGWDQKERTGPEDDRQVTKIETRLINEKFPSVTSVLTRTRPTLFLRCCSSFAVCLLLIDKTRAKDKTYIGVSVWWKT